MRHDRPRPAAGPAEETGYVDERGNNSDGVCLTLLEDRELHEAVENIYALDPPQRRLFTLANLLPHGLAQYLRLWVQGGR